MDNFAGLNRHVSIKYEILILNITNIFSEVLLRCFGSVNIMLMSSHVHLSLEFPNFLGTSAKNSSQFLETDVKIALVVSS